MTDWGLRRECKEKAQRLIEVKNRHKVQIPVFLFRSRFLCRNFCQPVVIMFALCELADCKEICVKTENFSRALLLSAYFIIYLRVNL